MSSNEVDYINLAAPAIIAAIISSLFMVGKKLNKSEQDILTGNIKLQELESKMDSELAQISKLSQEKQSVHEKINEQISKIHDKLAAVEHKLEMLEYRLFKVEKNGANNTDKK